MPLRDHFRPPLDDVTSWEGFHGQWPAVIVQQLASQLPPHYVAAPRVHLGVQIEIDVATFESEGGIGTTATESNNGGTTTALWSPSKPTLAVETELPDADEYEVRVYDTKRGRRLVAAVEIVSPSNKDRAEHRGIFVAKCAALLQQGVSVSIVDLVTVRQANLYAELLDLLGVSDPKPAPLYAVTCRWRSAASKPVLESWHHALSLGVPLPTLPMWLTDSLAVPLELEESYEKACRDLRIA